MNPAKVEYIARKTLPSTIVIELTCLTYRVVQIDANSKPNQTYSKSNNLILKMTEITISQTTTPKRTLNLM